MSKAALTLALCIPALAFPHGNFFHHRNQNEQRDVAVATAVDVDVVTVTVTGSYAVATPPAPAADVDHSVTQAQAVNAAPAPIAKPQAEPQAKPQVEPQAEAHVDTPTVDTNVDTVAHTASGSKPKPQAASSKTTTYTPGSGSLPFSRIVAFGDNLSDNGNGSVAHCVAAPGDCDNSIYGHDTWTDGPVAVSYLANDLGSLPLLDYAYGHSDGGSKFGATIDNSFTQSDAGAPSSKDQIANYTSDPRGDISSSLHFLWIGANDINLYHIMTWFEENHEFGDKFASLLSGQIKTLLDSGAKYVFVPNLYPKQIAPGSEFYASDQVGKTNLANAIVYANQQIKAAVDQFGPSVLYYDVYDVMMTMWDNGPSYGFTKLQGQFCDGYSQADWDACVMNGQGHEYYWMQYIDPTTYVHQYIAQDMAKAIQGHSWA